MADAKSLAAEISAQLNLVVTHDGTLKYLCAAVDQLAALATESADARDAARWRMLARHWKSAQMRWNREPNTPKTITMTIDFTQATTNAREIEAFFDAALQASAARGEDDHG